MEVISKGDGSARFTFSDDEQLVLANAADLVRKARETWAEWAGDRYDIDGEEEGMHLAEAFDGLVSVMQGFNVIDDEPDDDWFATHCYECGGLLYQPRVHRTPRNVDELEVPTGAPDREPHYWCMATVAGRTHPAAAGEG